MAVVATVLLQDAHGLRPRERNVMSKAVGIVGCGLLGSAVARTLASSSDHMVYAWDRTPERAQALGSSGVAAVKSIEDLVLSADLVLVTLTTYDTAEAVLTPVQDFSETTVIVVSTGVPADAARLSTSISDRGGDYLDAALLGYPADVGADTTVLVCSGAPEIWSRHEETLRLLGGASYHASTDVTAANAIDVAATGAFYTVAYGAIVEAASYAKARSLDPHALLPAADAWIRILRRNLEETASAIVSGAYETDQATVDVILEAAMAWREEIIGAGLRGSLMIAEAENLARTSEAGYGQLGFPAQSLAMTTDGASTS